MRDPLDSCTGDLISNFRPEQQLDLMRRLVDAATDAIIAHMPDGRLVFYNDGACKLLGLNRDEMAGMRPFGWIGPESTTGASERLEHILHERQLIFESTAITGAGEVIPTEVSATRVDTELGPLVVAVIRDTTARMEAERRLTEMAYTDPLTGLPNRHSFEEQLEIAISSAKRYGDLLVLAYIDLDRFKPINDRFGHETGDQVLIEIGRRLLANVRPSDHVARLGGDEFVALLQRVESTDEIPGIAQRLVEAMCEPILACGNDCRVEASIGFAVFDPATDDGRSLIVHADTAMYEAKKCADHPWLVYAPPASAE